MQRMEVSGEVRLIYRSLGVKGLKETSFEGVLDWLQESRYRIQWRTLVIMVMNLQFP